MHVFLELIRRLALAIWIGSLVMLSFIVAPTLFRELPPESAGTAVGAILSGYARLGVACGAIAAVISLLLARRAADGTTYRVAAAMLALMIILTLYASEVIAPVAHDLRAEMHAPGLTAEEAASRRAAFGAVHRRSVLVHGLVLALGIVLLAYEARAGVHWGSRAVAERERD
jgi:uncharacterized membrane protein